MRSGHEAAFFSGVSSTQMAATKHRNKEDDGDDMNLLKGCAEWIRVYEGF